jgi:multiple sugar transport system permease protein
VKTSRLSFGAAVLRHAFLIVTSIFMLFPFFWMVVMSLRSPEEMFSSSLSILPKRWYAIENYTAALTRAPLLHFMANSVFVCAVIVVFQIMIAMPCAYALAKLKFGGKGTLFQIVLGTIMLPQQVLAVPLFVLLYEFGLLNSYAALILPWTISVFGIFLFRQFFQTIPDDYVHAARLDGMSEIGILCRIMVPMALPAIAAFTVASLVAHWNDLFWPMIAGQGEAIATAPLGLTYFWDAENGADYGALMAGAVIITLPLVVVFGFLQRWFIRGMSISAEK